MTRVVDACAVIAYLRGESGADVMKAIVQDPGVDLVIHAVNACEVAYDARRAGGQDAADAVWRALRELPLRLRRDVDDAFLDRVGAWKVTHGLSLGDSFAAALAERVDGALVTTDHHEFDALERAGVLRCMWLR
jgi:predicted nucleic acid-binding protein